MTAVFTDRLQCVLIQPTILPYENRQCVWEVLIGGSTFNNTLQKSEGNKI